MNKNIFWQIIDDVNSQMAGDDYDGILRATQERLLAYTPEEIADWGSIQRYYKDSADTGGVFAASCFLNDYMSDDGFNDFRMWLISRGRDVYMAALKDPDTLADLKLPEDIQATMDTRWESYGYVANYAYEQTGRTDDFYDVMEQRPLTAAQKADIRVEIEYFPHTIRDHITGLPLLPKLCEKYDDKPQFTCRCPSAPKPGSSRFYMDAAQIAARYGYRAEPSPEFEAAFDILDDDHNGKRICAINKRVALVSDSFTQLPQNDAFKEMMNEIRDTLEHFDYQEHEGNFDHAHVRDPSVVTYFERVAKMLMDAGMFARLSDDSDEVLDIQNKYSRHIASVNGIHGNVWGTTLLPDDLVRRIHEARMEIPFENNPEREAERFAAFQKQSATGTLITEDNIYIDRELFDEEDHINALVSAWFDVDDRFDTKTYGTADYLNIYANYFPDTEELEVGYTLIKDDGTDCDFKAVEMASSEKAAILAKMKEAGLDKLIAEMNEDQDAGMIMQ